MLIDVLGFELDDAQKILEQNGVSWELELTEAPTQLKTLTEQYKLRVVKQKLLAKDKILLTVVKEL